MFLASALARHGLTSTASFFSVRNLAVLAVLKEEIEQIEDPQVQAKLRFAFTAILTRASKRYQWSRQRPLNAANATYYVSPVFYEWNVYDLFERKVEAVLKSDDWISARRGERSLLGPLDEGKIDVTYELASADRLTLPDGSVDYVFMDPPFGSNIFYSDMSLFHEAWLGRVTDLRQEAVVDRVDTGHGRTAARYERLLVGSLRECVRVLKPEGHLTMVFGNSSGAVWALVQRAIAAAGLVVVPEFLATLNKGQRSVKGLASGFENVATLDLMLTMRRAVRVGAPPHIPEDAEIESVIIRVLEEANAVTPSHLYVELLRHGFRHGWDLSGLDLRKVGSTLSRTGITVHPKTGRLLDAGTG